MSISLKTSKILTFAGAGISVIGAIATSTERANCAQETSWGWGLLHSLSVMNAELREQACLNESLKSPSTFIIVAGLIALAIGVTNWIRITGKSSGKRTKCVHCAEEVLVDASICKHCGKDLPKQPTS